jgi:hypothetical protein
MKVKNKNCLKHVFFPYYYKHWQILLWHEKQFSSLGVAYELSVKKVVKVVSGAFMEDAVTLYLKTT